MKRNLGLSRDNCEAAMGGFLVVCAFLIFALFGVLFLLALLLL